MLIQQLVLRPADLALVAHYRDALGVPGHTSIDFANLDSSARSAVDTLLQFASAKLPDDIPEAVVNEIQQLEARLSELRATKPKP